MVAEFTKDPYVEVWGLNQESGFSVHAMRKTAGPNGEKSTSKHEWVWHAPIERLSPVPVSKMVASASLVGPNTIQIIYMTQPGSGLEVTMIQTHTFSAAGVEVQYSKCNQSDKKCPI